MTINKTYMSTIIHKLVEDIKAKEMDYGMNGVKVQLSFNLTEAQVLLDALLKTEKPEQTRWIPCSERLPELDVNVNVYKKNPIMVSKPVYISYKLDGRDYVCPIPCILHSNGNWYNDSDSLKDWVNLDDYDSWTDSPLSNLEVTAWMPLPERYKPEGEVKK